MLQQLYNRGCLPWKVGRFPKNGSKSWQGEKKSSGYREDGKVGKRVKIVKVRLKLQWVMRNEREDESLWTRKETRKNQTLTAL